MTRKKCIERGRTDNFLLLLAIREQYANWYKNCTSEDIFNLWQAHAQLSKPQPKSHDAERWRYFIETCSEEAAFELTGIPDASNEQINSAVDAKMKEAGL